LLKKSNAEIVKTAPECHTAKWNDAIVTKPRDVEGRKLPLRGMKAMLRWYLIKKLKIAASYSGIFTFISIRRFLFDCSILLKANRVSLKSHGRPKTKTFSRSPYRRKLLKGESSRQLCRLMYAYL